MKLLHKLQIDSNNKNDFYQSKYEYYEKLVFYIVLTACVSSFLYWFSDCFVTRGLATNTILPRLSVFIFFGIYFLITNKYKSYKICILASYLMVHVVLILMCISIYILDNKTHASEILIIFECIFAFIGIAAPKKYSVFFHSLILVDIGLTNVFNHYDSFYSMLITHFFIIISSEIIIFYMEKVYNDKYISNLQVNHILMHDQLTDAYNRNIFSTICHPGTNMLLVKNAGILILDIDFFKKINDTYGHDVGDEVLRTLAEVVRNTIRSSDYLIRYGGEEFVVILNNVNKDILLETGKRINQAVIEGLTKYRVTVSIGGCMYDELTDYVNAIKLADEQLYYVKEHGRNNVRVI